MGPDVGPDVGPDCQDGLRAKGILASKLGRGVEGILVPGGNPMPHDGFAPLSTYTSSASAARSYSSGRT